MDRVFSFVCNAVKFCLYAAAGLLRKKASRLSKWLSREVEGRGPADERREKWTGSPPDLLRTNPPQARLSRPSEEVIGRIKPGIVGATSYGRFVGESESASATFFQRRTDFRCMLTFRLFPVIAYRFSAVAAPWMLGACPKLDHEEANPLSS